MCFISQASLVLWVKGTVDNNLIGPKLMHYFQYLDPLGIEKEKKELAKKSLEALTKMGHKNLKLTEHESPSATAATGCSKRYSFVS